MSWAFRLSRTATASLQSLELWLAEEVLDELENACANSDALQQTGNPPLSIVDVVRRRDSRLHYVFLSIEVNDARKMLDVQTVGYFARPQ